MRLIQLLSRGLGLPGIGAPALLPDAGNPNPPVSFQATGVPSAGLRCWEKLGSAQHARSSWLSLRTGLQGKGRNKSIASSPWKENLTRSNDGKAHQGGLIKEAAKLPSLDAFRDGAEGNVLIIILGIDYLPKSTKGGLHKST